MINLVKINDRNMPILSKPLFGLVRKGGHVIWQEESATRFPALKKLPPSFLGPMIFLFVGIMPTIAYFKAQKDYNPLSWYAKVWSYVELKFDGLFPSSSTFDKSLTPEEEQELRRKQDASPPIFKKTIALTAFNSASNFPDLAAAAVSSPPPKNFPPMKTRGTERCPVISLR